MLTTTKKLGRLLRPSPLATPSSASPKIFSATIGTDEVARPMKSSGLISSLRGLLSRPQKNINKGVRYTSDDWFRNLRSLPASSILRRIRGHLSFNILLAIGGCVWHTLHPEIFPNIGVTGHSLSGAALSLLLVFRTNSAYDRFWEARKKLGSVVDNCRGLARIAPTALPPYAATEFGRMTIAFPYMLRQHLTGNGNLKVKDYSDANDVLPFFNEIQLKEIESYFSKPFACLSIMNQILASEQARYPDEREDGALKLLPERQILQEDVNNLVAQTGACERILGCPVPLSYSRHLSRYLTLWSATLPFVLVPMLNWWSVPAIAAVCWSLFSIEEIGHMIEEPFAGLPGDQVQTKRVADVIKRDTVNIFKQQLEIDLENPDIEKIMEMDSRAVVGENVKLAS
eukprot:jgi/Bigna1/144459/aug1.87_g19167